MAQTARGSCGRDTSRLPSICLVASPYCLFRDSIRSRAGQNRIAGVSNSNRISEPNRIEFSNQGHYNKQTKIFSTPLILINPVRNWYPDHHRPCMNHRWSAPPGTIHLWFMHGQSSVSVWEAVLIIICWEILMKYTAFYHKNESSNHKNRIESQPFRIESPSPGRNSTGTAERTRR